MPLTGLAAVLALFLLADPARAAPPKLALPVACKPGSDCFLQNHVDASPGTDATDYRCGGQTYDGHKGTDIRLRDRTAMDKGVAVLAAARGTVKAVRDGVADVSIRTAGTEAIQGRACGNGVVIDHGGTWVTQYCHLRKGSVRVKPGQRVRPGTPLGLVGLSGQTEFVHLHFEVRRGDTVIDPFTAAPAPRRARADCTPRTALWTPAAAAALAYQPATLVDAAFTGAVPVLANLEDAPPPRPDSVSPALVAWVRVLGVRSGDVETLTVTDPLNGTLAASGPKTLDRAKAQWLSYAGRKRDIPSWPLGNYRARYTLERDGRLLIDREFSFSLVR